MTTLPPGPAIPRVLQMLQWIRRPLPFMEECARAYGDCFTIGFPSLPGAPARSRRPTFVFFSDPEAIREIFTGDGEDLRAGEARRPRFSSRSWARTRCSSSTERATCASAA